MAVEPAHRTRERAKDILRRADDLIDFFAVQNKPKPKQIALTLKQFQVINKHLGGPIYRGVRFYPKVLS